MKQKKERAAEAEKAASKKRAEEKKSGPVLSETDDSGDESPGLVDDMSDIDVDDDKDQGCFECGYTDVLSGWIQCDSCNKWFHKDCTEEQQDDELAKFHFYCKFCQKN